MEVLRGPIFVMAIIKRRGKMKEIRTEIDIQASPEKVWQVLTALDKYPEWNPFLHHASGRAEPGGKVDVTFKYGSKDMTLHCGVIKYEPNHEISWRYHVGLPFLYQGEHIFTIETSGNDKVHFIDREVFTGLLVSFMVNEKDNAGFKSMDQALKTRAEGIK
jgi:hypothetical protein